MVFDCFCGRFSDLEVVMAINLDIKSLLKRTLNQCGPVFFSKIEIKGHLSVRLTEEFA